MVDYRHVQVIDIPGHTGSSAGGPLLRSSAFVVICGCKCRALERRNHPDQRPAVPAGLPGPECQRKTRSRPSPCAGQLRNNCPAPAITDRLGWPSGPSQHSPGHRAGGQPPPCRSGHQPTNTPAFADRRIPIPRAAAGHLTLLRRTPRITPLLQPATA